MNNYCALYRHFSKNGELLYIGISLSVLIRQLKHKYDSVWYDDVARIEIEHFPSREMAIKAEKLAVNNEQPKYNIEHREKILVPGIKENIDAQIAYKKFSSGQGVDFKDKRLLNEYYNFSFRLPESELGSKLLSP